MQLQNGGPAPYAPATAVTTVLERSRNGSLPVPVDAGVLARIGVQDSLVRRAVATLKQLGVIDDEGQPTSVLEGLRKAASGDVYREAKKRWLEATYGEVLGILGDLHSASYEQVENAFRGYEPHGQRARMVSLFVGLCEYAELVEEGKLRPSAARRTSPEARRMAKPAAKKPRRQQLAEAQRIPEEGPVPPLAPPPRNELGLDPMVQGLVARLPEPESVWPAAKRRAWLNAAAAVFDVLYELPDDEVVGEP